MRLVFVRADDILGDGDRIVRQSLVVDPFAVRVADLFFAGTIAFDRALVNILIVLLLLAGLGGHGATPRYNGRMTERTLAIIKPDAVARRLAGKIIQRIEEAGFQIRAMQRVQLTKAQAEGFYAVHRERPFFGSLTAFMSSGPAVVLVLEAPDAIKRWRTLMGATDPAKADAGTLRKEFAESIERNATHGSDASETAAYEIGYFFAGVELI